MQDQLLNLLSDEGVYQRTPAGQPELTDHFSQLSTIQRRFLGAVTGHPPMRVLLELGLDDLAVGEAIVNLAAQGFVAQVHTR